MKALNFTLAFLIIIITGDAALSQASQKATQFRPLPNKYFNPNQTMLPKHQNVDEDCIYNVAITTSCQSPRSPRDDITLFFADADFNKVFAERVNDPDGGRYLEPCSTYELNVNGKCINQICYMGIIRYGDDGWMLERVSVSGPNTVLIEFKFPSATFLEQGRGYGIDKCLS